MVKILHFADAHIDMANFGSLDPKTGFPQRVGDFLKSLDFIIDTAIREKVDLVIFAGDTYKGRNPLPTYQREWGRRIMRLSRASIPTLLITGNHDVSPSQTRAHTMQEFDTLQPDFVRVASTVCLLGPDQLFGVPVQLLALPWPNRGFIPMRMEDEAGKSLPEDKLVDSIQCVLDDLMQRIDPHLPLIFASHISVQTAIFSTEQIIKIGRDIVLPLGMVRNPRFDYVALGHIHRFQDLNLGAHPPVIYPGSIERIDFGEINDDKGFIIAEVDKGHTQYCFHKLPVRPFYNPVISLESREELMEKILAVLPSDEKMRGAIVKLSLTYPQELESFIDEARLYEVAQEAFEFTIEKTRSSTTRSRLPSGQQTSVLSPLELVDFYFRELGNLEEDEIRALNALAGEIISGDALPQG